MIVRGVFGLCRVASRQRLLRSARRRSSPAESTGGDTARERSHPGHTRARRPDAPLFDGGWSPLSLPGMLRWWRSASTRAKASIALVLMVAGGCLLAVGLAALHEEHDSATGSQPPRVTVVPSRTRTVTTTFPGGGSAVVRTVTITVSASTALVTSSTNHVSGGSPDHTVAVALISAGALIIGSAITATSAILVAKVAKHA